MTVRELAARMNNPLVDVLLVTNKGTAMVFVEGQDWLFAVAQLRSVLRDSAWISIMCRVGNDAWEFMQDPPDRCTCGTPSGEVLMSNPPKCGDCGKRWVRPMLRSA